MKNNETLARPVKLRPTRVWRSYIGGMLIDRLHGKIPAEDGNFPEEWIASTTIARNPGREELKAGLSLGLESGNSLKEMLADNPRIMLGDRHYEKFGPTPGVLAKLIDSAERLTIQVHPDKEAARNLFSSPFGKTECWHIIGTRSSCTRPPCIYLGFKPGVTRRQWEAYFAEQNLKQMLECLHCLEVKPGDTYLIEGGTPHAIGEGCFLIEIQEPTDFTIRTERRTPSGLSIPDEMCHQGLGFERMFDCFKYDGLPREQVQQRWKIRPVGGEYSAALKDNALIGYEKTPCFAMSEMFLRKSARIYSNGAFSVLYVLEGGGTLESEAYGCELSAGDQFFMPATLKDYTMSPQENKTLKMYRCFGPLADC